MATLGAWEKSKVHQTAKKVSELETAAESGLHYGATANDMANFPGMMNLVAGSGVSFTPGTGTLTITATGDWIGANNGTAYAAGVTNLSADTTWFDTGASVSLVAGTYLVTSFCHGLQVISAGTGQINSRLYNVTDAAAVTNSECKVISSAFLGAVESTGTLSMILTVAGTKSVRLEAQRAAGGTYSSVSARSSSTGRSGITYVRIA